MNSHTTVFLKKLAELMEEYKANLEIEGDSYGGIQNITLEVLNPQTFEEYYDLWENDHPGGSYPWNRSEYSHADWVNLGWCCTHNSIKEILK